MKVLTTRQKEVGDLVREYITQIGIPPKRKEDSGLPLIGRVAAGESLMAMQNIESHYRVDPSLFNMQISYCGSAAFR